MADEPIILADFSGDESPSKPKAAAPRLKAAEVQIEQVFQPRPPREWNVSPAAAAAYLSAVNAAPGTVEAIFAGKYIGLVHLIPQTKDALSVIIQLDAAHQMQQTAVFSGRWSEPQVNSVIRKAEKSDREMPQVIADEFDQAALDSLTRIQAKDRVQAVIDTVTALLDFKTHQLSVGELADRKDPRGVSRMSAPITVIFPSGTVFTADCDAIHGLRNVQIAYADPHNLSVEELLGLAK